MLLMNKSTSTSVVQCILLSCKMLFTNISWAYFFGALYPLRASVTLSYHLVFGLSLGFCVLSITNSMQNFELCNLFLRPGNIWLLLQRFLAVGRDVAILYCWCIAHSIRLPLSAYVYFIKLVRVDFQNNGHGMHVCSMQCTQVHDMYSSRISDFWYVCECIF